MAVLSVIEFRGSLNGKWLIYRHPNNEFNTKSKLVVGAGQVAVVIYGGKVESVFENGTYTMDNVNLPFLKSLQKNVYGGKTPFMMDVYFVNKVIKLDMLWGTSDPIQLLEPEFKVRVNVRARGQYGLRIRNYQFLVTELVGTLGGSALIDFEKVNTFFRGIINTKIKTLLAQEIINNDISLLNISAHLEKISGDSLEALKPEFSKYGMELVNFYYESINIPDADLERINEILNKNAEFNILGDGRYRTSRGYDVLESAAKNEGGGMAATGMGLGVGLGVGKEAMNMSGGMIPNKATVNCISCKAVIESDDKFCPECGAKQELSCNKCHAKVEANDKFCPECGSQLKRGS